MSDSSENPSIQNFENASTPSHGVTSRIEAPHVSNVQTMSLGPEPAAILYSVKLNGVNYSLWSQVVETFVAGRGKLGYVMGKILEPSTNDASYGKCSMENAIVKGWLISAMEPDKMNLFVR